MSSAKLKYGGNSNDVRFHATNIQLLGARGDAEKMKYRV